MLEDEFHLNNGYMPKYEAALDGTDTCEDYDNLISFHKTVEGFDNGIAKQVLNSNMWSKRLQSV